jgi:mRNA interferase RelE/StbE
MKIEVSEQVQNFIRSCSPEPRRLLREGLRNLAEEKGDIKALDGELAGYCRLRVRTYRIIFRYETDRRGRKIFCPFAEHRGVVYEAFMRVLED